MSDCLDIDIDPGKTVSFNGAVVADGMPPPTVEVSTETNQGKCKGYDGYRESQITLTGELVCCDPDDKIDAREELLEQFSSDCGDLTACGETWENARVQGINISQSHYRDNVSYTVTLLWRDPEYPDEDLAKITNASNVIDANEDDTTVTISHRVEATAAEVAGCAECGCDLSGVKNWALGEISSSAPTPEWIQLPQNQSGDTLNCPDIEESVDTANCTYSIIKTWAIAKKPIVVDDGDGNLNIQTTKCTTTSEDRNQLESVSVSGTITYIGSAVSCDDPNDPKFMSDVEAVFGTVKSGVVSQYSAKHGSPDSTSITKSENPATISYTIDFTAEPLGDTRGDTIDEYCASGSIGSDGIISVTVSGVMRANDATLKTQSRQCKCDAIEKEWDTAKYFTIGKEFYQSLKESLSDEVLKKLLGPCQEGNELNPTARKSSEKDGQTDCAKNYSYTWDDKKDRDEQWNYTISITHKLEKVSIRPMLGDAFCVIKGPEEPGSVNISGQRSQNCPGDEDENWDKEGIAKSLIKEVLPDEELKPSGKNKDCVETKTFGVGVSDSAFNYTYSFGDD